MQCLVKNAKRVIETTLKHEQSQWRRQIMAEADKPGREKVWNQQPVKQNDWGAIEYRR